MPKAKKPRTPFNLDATLPALLEALRSRRALNAADLGRLGVPPAARTEALACLAGEGFEATKTHVRIPLRDQLLAVLEERGMIPLQGLEKLVAGAAAKETKSTAEELAHKRQCFLVLRGKNHVLASSRTPVLDKDELRTLARATNALSKQCTTAMKGATPKTLLDQDVRELLLDIVTRPAKTTQPATPLAAPDLQELVVTEVRRLLRPQLGLTYVPDVVQALRSQHSVEAIQAALLDAARARRIELRPESGMGRLSAEDAALCPPGAHGTRLSWTRPLEEVLQ
jgi:hypothetical protein